MNAIQAQNLPNSIIRGKGSPFTNKCFSVFLALYPLLCLYKAVFRFTVGDVLLFLFFFLAITHPVERDRRFVPVALFIGYAFMILLVNLAFVQLRATDDMPVLLLRILKFTFYLFCVFTCGKTFFDKDIFFKSILFLGVAACIYIVIQYIAYYVFHKILLGYPQFLPIYLENYTELNYERVYSIYFRPSSFFLEPAQFSQYVAVPLAMVLFSDKPPKGPFRVVLAGAFTAGIVLSAAGQGILYLLTLYVIFGFRAIKNKTFALCFFLAALLIAIFCYHYIPVVQIPVSRLFNENATGARFGSYRYAAEQPLLYSLFGWGYGVVPNTTFMAGAAYVWYGTGLIGLVLAISIFITFYYHGHTLLSHTLCLLFFIMFFGTSLFYNYMVFWYFTLIANTSRPKGAVLQHEHPLYPRRI